MRYFLNAMGASFMAVGFMALAVYIRDINHLPLTRLRSYAAWVASLYYMGVTAAWIVNGYYRSQTPYGRLIQDYGWIGRSIAGSLLTFTVVLGYRTRRQERAERLRLKAMIGVR